MDNESKFRTEAIRYESAIFVERTLKMAEIIILSDPSQTFVYPNLTTDPRWTKKKYSTQRESAVSNEKPQDDDIDDKDIDDKKIEDKDVEDKDIDSKYVDDKDVGDKDVKDKDIVVDENSVMPCASSKSADQESGNMFFGKQNFNIKRNSTVSQLSQDLSFLMRDPLDHRNTIISNQSARSTFESVRRDAVPLHFMDSVLWHELKNEPADSIDYDQEHDDDDDVGLDDELVDKLINFEWISYQDFSVDKCNSNIMEFVSLWKLSPNMKFCMIPKKFLSMQCECGDQYVFNVAFSKPTPACPNPLAVANVIFNVYQSHIMPTFYPVRVTYRFEGYKMNYHAQGHENVHSVTFQVRFIESILNAKLSFYVELFECENGSLNDETQALSIEEEIELLDKQHEMNIKTYLLSSKKQSKKIPKSEEKFDTEDVHMAFIY